MGTTKEEACGGGGRSNLAVVALAVAGTLALSVPTTALLTLYLSRESGRVNITEQQVQTTHPKARAEKLQHEKTDKHVMLRQQHDVPKPATHLRGWNPNDQTLAWDSVHSVAFSQHQEEDRSLALLIPRRGFYYVYCQVGFRGSHCGDGDPLFLSSQVYTQHDSYMEPILLLEGMESVCGQGNTSGVWYTSLSQGALVLLETNHKLFVNVNHPKLVDYQEGKTFFGAMMVS